MDDAPTTSLDDEWLTINGAARRLGVTATAIRNRIKRGTLEVRPNGNFGRLVRVPLTVPEPSPELVTLTVPPTVPEAVPLTVPEPVPEAVTLTVRVLGRHIERIETEMSALKDAHREEVTALTSKLATVTSEREAACEQAIALRISISGLEATCAALRDEVERSSSRGWWRRLTRR